MTKTLYWMSGGGCGGDTHSLLNADSPSLIECLRALDVEVLWHPSLSAGGGKEQIALLDDLRVGARPLDILCVEGAVIQGPSGTGRFDTFLGEPRQDILSDLARRARFVVAVGTCAAFGGVTAEGGVEATGLQYLKSVPGGFLGTDYRSGSGLPVVNLPGCPCHPDVVTGTLTALVRNGNVDLDAFQAPPDWYNMLVHQGCTRNEYHEYRVEDAEFGQKGCMFFHLGCRGPLAYGPCNKILWNQESSKTRVGVPCVGCTQPDFPQSSPFFETPNIEGIPLELPNGVDRAHYMAYKGMAAAAAPDRLIKRKTEV